MILTTRSLVSYFAHIVQVKFAHHHLLIIPTEPACRHNSFWGNRCDSNHAHLVFLKTLCYFTANSAIISTHNTFYLMTYFIIFNGQQVHSPVFSVIIFSKSITFWLIPAETNLSRLSTQKLYKQPKAQIIPITQIMVQCKESVLTFQNIKLLQWQRPTGLIHLHSSERASCPPPPPPH